MDFWWIFAWILLVFWSNFDIKIDSKWYHLASKKRPKWYLSDPEASNLPTIVFMTESLVRGGSLRPPNPSQFAPKILLKSVMKALCLTNSKLTAFWNGSGTSWTPILKCFFKYLRAKMISNSDKNTKMKILQNTCGFTVKMHFRNLNNITTTLKQALSVCTSNAYKTKKQIWPSPGPQNQSLKEAQNRSESTKKRYPKGVSNHTSKNKPKKSCGRFGNPPPPP